MTYKIVCTALLIVMTGCEFTINNSVSTLKDKDHEIIQNIDEIMPVIEYNLNQFAIHTENKNFNEAFDLLTNEAKSNFKNTSDSDMQIFSDRFFTGYREIIVSDITKGQFKNDNSQKQYKVNATILYEDTDNSSTVTTIFIRENSNLKIDYFNISSQS